MILFRHAIALSMFLLPVVVPVAAAERARTLVIEPSDVLLEGDFARAQLLVTQQDKGVAAERSPDRTHASRYVSLNPRVATVTAEGQVLARGNGDTAILVLTDGQKLECKVKVRNVGLAASVRYSEQVVPILAKAGCSAGACHASQHGKGGFKLSVFGFAPDDDHHAIVRDGLGRRLNRVAADQSLFLLKPTAAVPHGGGQRFAPGSVEHETLKAWIAEGSPGPKADAPRVTALRIHPARRVGPVGMTQQLQIHAAYSDGKSRDVTALAKYDTLDEGVAQVSPTGFVRTVGKGQGGVMVRFEGQAEVASIVVPYSESVELADWVDRNFVDRLAAAKFKEIGIAPSPVCDDATFLRRAFLDATGTLPSVERAAAFLDSPDPAKRDQLIDELLGLTGDPKRDVHDNHYAAFWALKWSDLIRTNSASLGEQGMWSLYNWLKDSFRENKPFDRFVRELITAKGSTFSNGPSNYFRIASNPNDLTEATSQLFLGVRMQCAKCHHHPFEKISQADYYGFAAFFARVGSKGSQEFGLFGGESVIVVRADGEVSHPKTGKVLKPTPLHGQPVDESTDRRRSLADWLTARDNAYFARGIVNRYVGYLLGRGLCDPIDDMRATNPPSNAALLDALAADFAKSGYNVKHLMRTIMRSRLYQLESQPTRGNASDSRFFSHFHVKRLGAEPLLDAIDSATGVQTKFEKLPLGTKAIELPDAQYKNYFLKAFGKPRREGVCECERISDPNLAQALHTLNGDTVAGKIADPKGRIARAIAAKKPEAEVVTELYLAALSRRPTEAEREACRQLQAEAGDAQTFYQDLLWSLINSKQFLFVR